MHVDNLIDAEHIGIVVVVVVVAMTVKYRTAQQEQKCTAEDCVGSGYNSVIDGNSRAISDDGGHDANGDISIRRRDC